MSRSRWIALAMSLLLASLTPVIAETPLSPEDKQAIRQAALDYAEGWYAGDAERMKRALHSDLSKRIVNADLAGKRSLKEMTSQQLIDATGQGWGKNVKESDRRTDVKILDVYRNAASVRLEMHDWVDYMHIGRTDEGWKVINVLWERTASAEEKHREWMKQEAEKAKASN